jgi:hypothetical protein
MVVYLLFAVALIVGYSRPVFILAAFPILLLYGGYWAFGPLLLAVFALMSNRADGGTRKVRRPAEPEYKPGYEN